MAAAHLRSAASFHASLALLEAAGPEAEQAGRLDLQARILGLRGNVLARMGRAEEGLTTVRAGLGLALEHDLTVAATEISSFEATTTVQFQANCFKSFRWCRLRKYHIAENEKT